jgi:hypothetical protein
MLLTTSQDVYPYLYLEALRVLVGARARQVAGAYTPPLFSST